jgi:hypothetical protein
MESPMHQETHLPEAAPARAQVNVVRDDSELIPLDLESRSHVDTQTAAHHLSRRPQTLRSWACCEDGPLRPIRLHGRLLWPVADIKRLLGVAK